MYYKQGINSANDLVSIVASPIVSVFIYITLALAAFCYLTIYVKLRRQLLSKAYQTVVQSAL